MASTKRTSDFAGRLDDRPSPDNSYAPPEHSSALISIMNLGFLSLAIAYSCTGKQFWAILGT
jgi:hypothetical protein